MTILWYLFVYPYIHAIDYIFMIAYAGRHIDPGGFDGRVSENIRQMGQIPLNRVKTPGKQMSEIMGKHLRLLHPCLAAVLFHLMAYITTIQGPSVS